METPNLCVALLLSILFLETCRGFKLCETCYCRYSGNNNSVDVNCRDRQLGRQDFLPLRVLRIDRNVSIKSINLSWNSISRIPELGNTPDLQSLDLSENFINSTSDVLNNFTNLLDLNLSRNRIKTVEVAISILTLERLNLSHCEIRDLGELRNSKLPNLSTLDLSHNRLTFLKSESFENFKKLTTLDLSWNLIEIVDLSGLSTLSILNVGNNVIADAVFPVHLTKLYAENNKMETLPKNHNLTEFHATEQWIDLYSSFDRLEFLNLSGNELSLLPNSKYPELAVLDLSRNKFTEISEYLSSLNFPTLKRLDLSENAFATFVFPAKLKLESLKAVRVHTIRNLKLDSLKNLGNHESQCLNLTLRNNSKLESFDSAILSSLKVCSLDLSYNNFTYLHTFLKKPSNWKSVKFGIDFQGNPIHCDCNSQIILDEFLPWFYTVLGNTHLLENLRCAKPDYMSNMRLVHWYKKTKRVFCDKKSPFVSKMMFQSAEVKIEMKSGKSMLTALVITLVLFVALALVGLILAQRGAAARSRKNRRF